MTFPSGEISACPSEPGQSVMSLKPSEGSGFSMGTGRRPSHRPTSAASVASPIHGSHHLSPLVPERRSRQAGARQNLVDRVDLDPDVADISQPLLRILGEAAKQQPPNGRGVVAGSADQSGSRSRIFAIESETVSPANVTRPVNIS